MTQIRILVPNVPHLFRLEAVGIVEISHILIKFRPRMVAEGRASATKKYVLSHRLVQNGSKSLDISAIITFVKCLN